MAKKDKKSTEKSSLKNKAKDVLSEKASQVSETTKKSAKFTGKKLFGIHVRIAKLPMMMLSLVLLAIVGVSSFFVYDYIFKDLPDPRGLKNYAVIPLSSQIYDRNGELLYEIYSDQNRTPVTLDSLPVYIPQATIAIEDSNFYNHGGISIVGGIGRAVKDKLLGAKTLQGGSTLTQQLIKSALLTPERTIRRKLREAVLALQIEQLLSKDEILELYLNQVPYGGVTYGIEEAAQTYFAKEAKDLSLAEAALLAGLPVAPTAYNPYTNFDRAKSRQEKVLDRMQEEGFISKEEKEKAKKEELTIRPPTNDIKAPHFVFYVKSILEEQYGKELVEKGGLKVITSLDYDIQASAEAILKEEVDSIRRLRVSNGALLVTRPPTGEILSMVGSTDFFATGSGSYNVTTASRQPGSSIKPINYAIGIDRKIVTPASVFVDAPTCFGAEGQPKPYCPVNYDGSFRGPVQLRFALANSLNIPAVKMLAKNSVEDFVASASSGFKIKSFKDPTRYGLSLTLGGGEVTMLEMAQAFSAFANEGVSKELVSILKVEDKNGKVLYEYSDPNYVEDVSKPLDFPDFLGISGERAISRETAFLISHILLDNNARAAAFGTNSELVIRGKNVSVKTGTTNDLRDNWTIGYTPNFLTAVWVGNNDNSAMSAVASGVTGASPIWNSVMSKVLENQEDLFPRKPDSVVGRQVCTTSGTVPGSNLNKVEGESGECPTRFEYIIEGTENIGAGYITQEQMFVNKNTNVPGKEGEPDVELQEHTVISDGLSKYCLDCSHEGEPNQFINVNKILSKPTFQNQSQ